MRPALSVMAFYSEIHVQHVSSVNSLYGSSLTCDTAPHASCDQARARGRQRAGALDVRNVVRVECAHVHVEEDASLIGVVVPTEHARMLTFESSNITMPPLGMTTLRAAQKERLECVKCACRILSSTKCTRPAARAGTLERTTW